MLDDEVVEDVIKTVLEQGEITKAQVIETWGLTQEEYKTLQGLVLERNSYIEKGQQRVGGFLIRKRKGRLPDEAGSDRILLRTDWEKTTVLRLSELLQHSQLDELLGKSLTNLLRQVRKAETGLDRRGTKSELASALVLQHGIDLFYDLQTRQYVAKACGVNYPQKWHPGKAAAVEFVLETGFPRELAGIPTPERFPDYEYLEGRFNLRPLRDFQIEVKEGLEQQLHKQGGRAIVALPTGAGKTRVAVESLRDWMTIAYDSCTDPDRSATVLWLAHTEELCEQAYSCFKQVWDASENVCPLLLVRFWGRYTQNLAEHRVELQQYLTRPCALVSTPQRMVNLLDGRIQGGEGVLEDLMNSLGLVLIDEAHRAAAPSYRRILEALKKPNDSTSVVGLTATPFRMEYLGQNLEEGTKELKEIFHKLVEPIKTLGESPRQKLQEMRVLATPVFDTIHTTTTMRIPNMPDGTSLSEDDLERIDRIMAVSADKTPRRLAILARLLPLAKDPNNSILYFGPSVRDAEAMAFLLRREDIPAAVISGQTRDVTRRQIVSEFRQKKIQVLCNCEVLTTGFDAPLVTHIVMGRPTVSRVLYEQIVGRGLRGPEFGGTEVCVILDCEDNFKGNRPPLGYESFRQVWQGLSGGSWNSETHD